MKPRKPAPYDIDVTQGYLCDLSFSWSIGNQPVDNTGYDARLRAWGDTQDATLSLGTELDNTGSGLVLGGADGTVRLIITSEKTASLSTRYSDHVVDLVRPDGQIIPFLAGTFFVKAGVPTS